MDDPGDGVDWEGLAQEEVRLRGSDLTTASNRAFMELWNFIDALQMNDELGTASMFFQECLRRALPRVALKASLQAFDNAFSWASSGEVDVDAGMVWEHVLRFAGVLKSAGHLAEAGDLLSFAAAKWCNSNPKSAVALHLEARSAFKAAGRPVDSSLEAASAARGCLQLDNKTGAAAYFEMRRMTWRASQTRQNSVAEGSSFQPREAILMISCSTAQPGRPCLKRGGWNAWNSVPRCALVAGLNDIVARAHGFDPGLRGHFAVILSVLLA
jgi:hypothetical protein